MKARADVSIDTTDFTAARLRKVVADKMLPRGTVGKLAVTFLTFGFKHGGPRDADLLFDVRFLPNPHYEDELRSLTGLDPAVEEYVRTSEGPDGLLRPPHPAAGLPPARLRAGGQGPPDGRAWAAPAAATARWWWPKSWPSCTASATGSWSTWSTATSRNRLR